MNAVSRIALLLLCLPSPGLAQSIVPAADGTATIVLPQGQQIQIRGGTETGSNLFHSFDRFNLDANQTATFFANPTIQNILGRVVNGEPSRINGLIRVNGNANLVLMNPAGILFGSTARLDVPAAFTATSANRIGIGAGEFNAIGSNSYATLVGTPSRFDFAASGGIFNAGNLAAGQAISLFGGTVLNTGTLSGGTVSIAAVPGSRSIRVTPQGSLLSLEIPDSYSTTRTLPELLTGGELQNATQATIENGVPTLTQAGTAIISGKVSGSNVQISGDRIGLIDATVQGESIRVGGDRQGLGEFPRSQFVFGNAATQIEGKDIVLWSDQATRFYGSITAHNGFIETSSQRTLDVTQARIDAIGGTWLLDPSDIVIATGGTDTLSAGVFDPPSAIATIAPATIESALNNGTNVTITTAKGIGGNGDITLQSPITQTGTATASLTLTGRRFIRDSSAANSTKDLTISLNNTSSLIFNLNQVNPEVTPSTGSIQDALNTIGTSNIPTQINLGAGVYTSSGAPILINKAVSIKGVNSANTILSGSSVSRVLQINPGANVTVQQVSIVEGKSPSGEPGGAILNSGNLSLIDVGVKNSSTNANGGGIAIVGAGASLSARSTVIADNAALTGGGIFGDVGTTIDLSNVYLGRNSGDESGGGVRNLGTFSSSNTTFDVNMSKFAGGGIHNSGTAIIDSSTFDSGTGGYGGAISNLAGGTVTITGSTFANNLARVNGGAIANDGTAIIDQSTFTQNRANTGVGGAISNSGSLTVTRSNFTGNSTAIDSGNTGGAIASFADLNSASQVSITNSNFTQNSSYRGGAIFSDQGSALTITNSRILNNQSVSDAGALYTAGEGRIENTTISNNVSTTGNGGGIANTGQLTVFDTTLSNNTATQGGGLFSSATTNLSSTTISGNTATQGGGLYVGTGNTEIQNTTIAKNQSDTGGIFNLAGTVRLRNTLIADNAGNSDVAGLFNDLGNNLIGIRDGSTGFTVSTLVGTRSNPINPRLAPLADNGGRVQTHALFPDSPAINAGNNTNVPALDQAGRPRIQGTTIDIGAFESTPILPPAPLPPTPQRLDAPPSTPAPTLKPTPKAQQTPSTVIDIERSFSSEFAQYYGFTLPKAATMQEIQDTLVKAQQRTGMRSGIIYAVFVSSAITPTPKSGEVLTDQIEPVTPLLRSQLKHADDRLELILVTATGRIVRYSTSATRAQVLQQAKLYRLAVSDVEDEGYFSLSKQLYQWLVQPLETELERDGIQGLIYCLDEGLRTAPIAAMSDDRGFVIDRYTVSMIPSVSLINRDIQGLTTQAVLAMGADYFQELEPLPAVPTELKLISEQFWKGSRFLNQGFTLERLLHEKQRTQAGILHLATHAQFNPGKPDQSFIQLWDRRIKLSEMSAISWANPALYLLVLSACDTAIDSVDAELGFTGLAAASGVHSVMGSLWEVSDVGTLALMSEFYIQLQKTSTRAEALRRAQLALRNGTVRIEHGILITSTTRVPLPPALQNGFDTQWFRHPFYWAAFTLVGNPW